MLYYLYIKINFTKFFMYKKIIFPIILLSIVGIFIFLQLDSKSQEKINNNFLEQVEESERNQILDEISLVEKYVKDNLSNFASEKAVLGGTLFVTNLQVDTENKSFKVEYEDGHIMGTDEFSYEIRGGEVFLKTGAPAKEDVSFDGVNRISNASILAYHTIAPYTGRETAEQKKYKVSPEVLEKQFIYLRDKGYTVIPLGDLVSFLEKGEPVLPEKPIVLTFDDGLDSQYENAIPLLKKYGYPATFFVYTLTVGKDKFMTWEQVREVMQYDITIGSHTKTHAFLTKLDDEALLEELAGSKKIIEEKINTPVEFLAYPFYMQNENVQKFVKQAGYRGALAGWKKETPSTESIFALKRNEANNDMKMFPSFLK